MKSNNDAIISTFEKLASIRYQMELTFIEQVLQNTDEKFFLSNAINSSMNLLKIAVNRRYSFEKDVFGQLRGKSHSEKMEEPDTKVEEEVESNTPEIIQVITILEEQMITIPLSIQNYDSASQVFIMEGGDIIELEQGLRTDEQLTFEPTVLTIAGGKSEDIKLIMKISVDKFETDKRYISSFTIKSKYEKKMNVLLNIVSREVLGDRTYPIIRMLRT